MTTMISREERDAVLDDIDIRHAAHEFLDRCGVQATPDVVGQLVEAFLPCLRIIAERGYDKDGKSWREQGWRGQLFEMMKRIRRLEFFAWRRRDPKKARDSGIDAINYAGFFLRLSAENPENVWGGFGEPDSEV